MADKLNLLLTSTAVAYFLASASMIFAGEEFVGYFGAARVLWHLLRIHLNLKSIAKAWS